MRSVALILFALVFGMAGGVLGYAGFEYFGIELFPAEKDDTTQKIARLEEQIFLLEEKLAGMDSRNEIDERIEDVVAEVDQKIAGNAASLRSSISAEMSERAERTEERIAEVESTVQESASNADDSFGRLDNGMERTRIIGSIRDGLLQDNQFREGVASVARQAAQDQKDKEKWEPTMDEMTETLNLSTNQRQLVEETIRGAQADMAHILGVPNENGVRIVDKLAEVLGKENPQERMLAMQELFLGLQRTPYPDNPEITYGQELQELEMATHSSIRGHLTPEQSEIFSQRKLDIGGVKIPGNPVAELITSALTPEQLARLSGQDQQGANGSRGEE
ncbi:MAG: hypothetical protein NUW37_07140 [Planctomycetes bacterium]|nr:hypothetical protein [Planctomycetota bacterium]